MAADRALTRAGRQSVSLLCLIVRVAGYSDYFVDLGQDLQNEIIARTEQKSM